jgi:hypothetical protein
MHANMVLQMSLAMMQNYVTVKFAILPSNACKRERPMLDGFSLKIPVSTENTNETYPTLVDSTDQRMFMTGFKYRRSVIRPHTW